MSLKYQGYLFKPAFPIPDFKGLEFVGQCDDADGINDVYIQNVGSDLYIRAVWNEGRTSDFLIDGPGYHPRKPGMPGYNAFDYGSGIAKERGLLDD